MSLKTNKNKHELLNKNGLETNKQLWLCCKYSNKTNVLDTGYPELNQQLHGHGWPLECTNELALDDFGIGELRLLLPALRQLTKQNYSQANILWIAPPFLPFAPAFIKEHIDVDKLTIVQTKSIEETLWATEQVLLADCCAAVFSWTGKYNLNMRQLRRLQLATQKTKAWNVLFRHSDCLQQASVSGLRLQLQSNSYSQLETHIIKQPYRWAGQKCTLSIAPHYENWQRLPAHLLPQHNQEQTPALANSLVNTRLANTHSGEPNSVASLGSVSVLQSTSS